jgi:hypothetical protein
MPGTLPEQSQKMDLSQPDLNDNWTKVSYKIGRSTQEENEREAKHANESDHWLYQTLPFPIATLLYWKRKLKTSSRKLVLKTRPNLLQSMYFFFYSMT